MRKVSSTAVVILISKPAITTIQVLPWSYSSAARLLGMNIYITVIHEFKLKRKHFDLSIIDQ